MHRILPQVNVGRIIFGLFLLFLPLSGLYAAPGCCSHHGGVSGCNSSTNHQLCKDGTSSPTCLCSGGTTSAPKKQSKTVNTTATPTTAPSSSATTQKKASTKGCCSKHGGVDKCDTATGYQICKDGTHSTTCKC